MEGPAARVLFLGRGGGGRRVEAEGPGRLDTLLTTTGQGWKRGPAYGPVLKMDREGTRRIVCRRHGMPRFLMPQV